MVWFKVDDTLAFHRKTVAAGNAAMGLWVRAGSWSAQQLQDGFVPDHIVGALGTKREATRLVSAELWIRVEGGFQFHQWDEPGRQPTREQVETDRAAARERMRKLRGGSRTPGGRTLSRSGEQDANERENEQRSSRGVRDSRPVPSRPGFRGGAVVDPPQDRYARGADDDDDQVPKIESLIITTLHEHTGRYVTEDWADKIRHQLLDSRPNVDNPLAYVAACIRADPRSFLPSPTPAGDPGIPEYPGLVERDNTEVNKRGRAAVEQAMRTGREGRTA